VKRQKDMITAEQKEEQNNYHFIPVQGKVVACYFLHCYASSVSSRGIEKEDVEWSGR
jgi:hypothetical protein